MEESKLTANESIGNKLTKDVSQVQYFPLGEGAAECDVCEEKLREGDTLVAFVFRPADKPTFELGHVKCVEHRHEPTEYCTLGVRELVLEGRVGTCTDHATQSSWPVLLSPQPRAVGPADTTTLQPLPGTAWFRRPIARSNRDTAVGYDVIRRPWRCPVVRTDHSDPDGDTPRQTPTDTHDGGR